MKSNSFIILLTISLLAFVQSCESSKSTQVHSKEMISKITINKVTMGSNSELVVTSNEILYSETQRGGTGDAVKGETSQKIWNEVNKLISKLDLSQIDQWEGPTQARFYDGARATTIMIESNGHTYNSQSFDEGEPPAQLKELYNYLESLVNQ